MDGLASVGLLLFVVAMLLLLLDTRKKRKRRAREQEAEARRVAAERDAFAAHQRALVTRFGEQAAELILARRLWQGATEEMLVAMHGWPADTREKVSKTKVVRTLCYYPQGRSRYALKVTIENGVVVGWESR